MKNERLTFTGTFPYKLPQESHWNNRAGIRNPRGEFEVEWEVMGRAESEVDEMGGCASAPSVWMAGLN